MYMLAFKLRCRWWKEGEFTISDAPDANTYVSTSQFTDRSAYYVRVFFLCHYRWYFLSDQVIENLLFRAEHEMKLIMLQNKQRHHLITEYIEPYK